MTLVERLDWAELRHALDRRALDGWLLFDFHGSNPIAQRMVGSASGLGFTRRLFVWLPQRGTPTVLVHAIDAHLVPSLEGAVEQYSRWQELHAALERLVGGRRIAMETSENDAVPYLDRVPAGVIQLLQGMGATVVSSDELVSAFAARWTDEELAQHRTVAETLAAIARETLADVVRLRAPVTEVEVQRRVLAAIEQAGLWTNTPPIVAFGTNSANAHHEPDEQANATLEPDVVILLDLWARPPGVAAWGDQTWMAYSGVAPPAKVVAVWEAVRDARDRVVARLQDAFAGGDTVTGADLDDAARTVLDERGLGRYFVHRTGHSIDLELHGSGPHLDNFETHDTRALVPGVGFSVEPGAYLPGEFGVRSEINVVLAADGPIVTPAAPQQDLVLPG